MAEHLENLKNSLANANAILENPFSILQAISHHMTIDGDNTSRELILRALEKRTSFGKYERILNDMAREAGLFPYTEEKELSTRDRIAYEYHRPPGLENTVVFHREQAEVFRRLIVGENIILSAPTSFGKSKIIDALISSSQYDNLAILVPTIALIDETRRRLSRFSGQYKIITQVSQLPGPRNLFVFTAERANSYEHFPTINFFAIDEFYKIGALTEDRKRTIALNQAFYKLSRMKAQFYLLGPSVREIPEGFEERFRCTFFPTTFATVAAEEIRVKVKGGELHSLVSLVRTLKDEPTLIYCKSPRRAREVTAALLQDETRKPTGLCGNAAAWIGSNFHPKWTLVDALRLGVGMHHGKIPRALAQYMVRAFNEGDLSVLVCTSTLIEGVNTRAKNVIIFDNKVASKKYDYFTFNNIRGRAGRMFQHFIGRIFLFHDPPQPDLPFVDFPVFTQGSSAPDGVLLQLDNADLSEESRIRLKPYIDQNDLPLDLLRKNLSVDPADLLTLARRLKVLGRGDRELLAWQGFPRWENLKLTCELIWSCLVPENRLAGVSSGVQLAQKSIRLQNAQHIPERVSMELQPGPYQAETPDEAIERVLEFDRTWASFELPRLLRAFSSVRTHVLGGTGNYAFYASAIENLFRGPYHMALEEYGLPIQLTDKLAPILKRADSFDAAIGLVKMIDPASLNLDIFERELLSECQQIL